MTEAEIEKQAEEYTKEKQKWIDDVNKRCHTFFHFGWSDVVAGFINGAKWGMEHSIEWHDLRENPNDLPKREYKNLSWSITVVNQLGVACHYNHNKSRWETPCFTEIEGVVKWCELPQFKE